MQTLNRGIQLLLACFTIFIAAAADRNGSVQPPAPGSNTQEPGKPPANEIPPEVWLSREHDSAVPSSSLRAAVQTFLKELIDEEARVCDVRFTDLNGDGVNELVASLDYSGRAFCNTVAIVSKAGNGFEKLELPAWNAISVDPILRDLDGDGIPELIVPGPLSDYEGARCMATWTSVYRWDGRDYADASRSFRTLYDDRRNELGERILEIERDPNLQESAKEETASCRHMERDAIERFLGIGPKAGFDRAVRWMNSDDPSLRRKAVKVFGDIDDRESQAGLRTLAGDRDRTVAAAAREQIRVKR